MSSENVAPPPDGGGYQGDDVPSGSETAVAIPEEPMAEDEPLQSSSSRNIGEQNEVPIMIVGPNNEEIFPEDIIVAPDGGWGWVIVLAAFMSNFVTDGTLYSFGTLLIPIANSTNCPPRHDNYCTEEFGLKATTAVSWVVAMLGGFVLCAGPFVSILANMFGFRVTAFIGGLTAFFGFFMAWLLNMEGKEKGPMLWSLYVFVGFMGGTGLCLLYLPSIITVGYYFEKKRALATGISLCGSGIGTFVYAPVTEYINREFGWPITLLVEGCMLLCCAGIAMLYRPIKPVKRTPQYSQYGEVDAFREPFILLSDENIAGVERGDFGSNLDSGPATPMTEDPKEDDLHPSGNDQPGGDIGSVDRLVGNQSGSRLGITSSLRIRGSRMDAAGPTITLLVEPSSEANIAQSRIFRVASIDTLNKPLHRPDILYRGALPREELRTASLAWKAVPITTTEFAESRMLMAPPRRRRCGGCKLPPFKEILNFSLLKSMTFLLFSCSGFVLFLGFFVPFAFIIDITIVKTGKKIEDAARLLSILGATDTVGRVFCGMAADRMTRRVLLINNIAVTILGVGTALIPLIEKFGISIAYAVVFGLCLSCVVGLRSILVVQLMGIDNLTNAFGLLCLFQGVAAFFGTPLAGYLNEQTGSWDIPFYVAGAFIFLSAVMCYPLNYMSACEKRRAQQKELVKVQLA